MNVSGLIKDAGNTYNKQLDKTRALVGKWDKTGLLEGIDHDYDKHGMAVLLENQARQLIDESSGTNAGTGAAGYEEWSGVALPLVRRIFAEIAAKDFVSVQPMNLPSGLVFWLDFKYGGAANATNGAFDLNSTAKDQVGTVHGVTNAAGDPTGGLYGAGSYGFSINNIESVAQTTAGSTVGNITIPTAAANDVPLLVSASQQYAGVPVTSASNLVTDGDINHDSEFSASYLSTTALAGKIAKVQVLWSSLDTAGTPDIEGVRAFHLSGSGIQATFPQFTKYQSDLAGNAVIQFIVKGTEQGGAGIVSGGDLTIASTLKVQYHDAPAEADRGDFEASTANIAANAEQDLGIPEIDVQLRSEAIVAKTRKLKAVWTPEFAQDLNAYHSIDAEAELTSMLSEYVSMEIDLEILDMLFRNALTKDYWHAAIGRHWNGNSGFSAVASPNAEAYNQGTWFQTLGTKIQKVSNTIHQKTMRGGANFLVCSPKVATILESIPGYAADTDGSKADFAMGVQKVGALNSRYQVYKNPYMLENQILMGFRGGQFLETGAVYAPYVPLIMTPLVYDPKNFTPRKGVMTRYAKKIVRPEFYGVIQVAGLDTL